LPTGDNDMNAPTLTDRQSEILEFMRTFLVSNGYPPTIREIAHATGIKSPNGVMCHVKSLMQKDKIRHVGTGSSRGYLPIVSKGCCPCCGQTIREAVA
jgi:SOS-response transcriptional repressor LexA